MTDIESDIFLIPKIANQVVITLCFYVLQNIANTEINFFLRVLNTEYLNQVNGVSRQVPAEDNYRSRTLRHTFWAQSFALQKKAHF